MSIKHEKYQRLIEYCKALAPTPTAVAHPCDRSSLESALQAAKMGLITPILVGPRARIEATARACDLDITGIELVDAPYSQASAAAAVQLVLEGRAEALMKGSLHTDELMAAVVKREGGLRTARRVSHCFVMDVPSLEQALIITDAAVNIAPTLEDKVDILQNAIDLAHAMNVSEVRVAILSAMETVTRRCPRRWRRPRCARWSTVTRSPARWSTVRSRSTTRSTSRRRASSRSIRRWPGAPTC